MSPIRATALFVLVLSCCCIRPTISQSCSSTVDTLWIEFASSTGTGSRSYINKDRVLPSAYRMTPGVSMPLVVVLLRQRDAVTGQSQLALTPSGFMISASATPSIAFTGSSVAVQEGKAVFSALTPSDCVVGQSYTVTFSLRSQSGLLLNPSPLTAQIVCSSAPLSTGMYVDFGPTGFITQPNRNRTIPIGAGIIPVFTVIVFNAFGFPDTSALTSTISVTMSNGAVTSSLVVPSAILRAADGVFTVAGLTFTPSSASVSSTVLRISVVGAAAIVPLSATLPVVQAAFPAAFMAFDTDASKSCLNVEGGSLTAVNGVAMPPLRILLYDSLMNVDTSTTDVVIAATCSESALQGQYAPVDAGVATFDSLSFATQSSLSTAVLTFTAMGSESRVAQPLYSGIVTVTSSALVAAQLQFSPASSIQGTGTTTLALDSTNSFVLPNLVVFVVDSAFQLDTTANGIQLNLQLQGSSASTSSGTATVTNGVASFGTVVYHNGAEGSSFSVCVTDPSVTIKNSKLCSGTITLASASSSVASQLASCLSLPSACRVSIAFAAAPRSLIYRNGQSGLFATVGRVMPEIQVELRDQFGSLRSAVSSDTVPFLVAYTGDAPDEERYLSANGRVATWRQLYYSFSCLRFVRQPSGLVRLRFALVASLDDLETLFPGVAPLRSGYVRIAATVTPGYGLRFRRTNAVFSRAGQSSTAVINVALPPIAVEVIDSNYELDTSASGWVVVATASSGTLSSDGVVAVVDGGVATFHVLRFTSPGLAPTLTFRASRTTAPVNGQFVSTGIVTVTASAIPASEIVFSSTPSPSNNVSFEYQSFTFTAFDEATLRVAVTVRDSAHATAPTVERTVVISQLSLQGELSTSQVVTLSQGSASSTFLTASFLTYQSGFDGCPLYLTYQVTGGSSPFLIGSTIVVGPIFVAGAMNLLTCESHYSAPVLSLLYRVSLATFNVSVATASLAATLTLPVTTPSTSAAVDSRSSLATLVPQTSCLRLLPLKVAATASVDAVTLTRWTGTKLTLLVRPSSTGASEASTESSSRRIAETLVAYRPTCSASQTPFSTASSYTVQSAVYLEDDTTCVSRLFDASLALSANCSVSGYLTTCQCYALYSMSPYGEVCSYDPAQAATFTQLCAGPLLGCVEPSVAMACAAFTPPPATSTAAYLALVALVVLPLGVAAYCIVNRTQAKKVLLNSERQTEIDQANRSVVTRLSEVKKMVSVL